MDERARPLERSDLDPDPLRQFNRWFEDAQGAVRAPEAMAIATATGRGAPSVRMVLLKEFDERGFVFFTGYASRKGRDRCVTARSKQGHRLRRRAGGFEFRGVYGIQLEIGAHKKELLTIALPYRKISAVIRDLDLAARVGRAA